MTLRLKRETLAELTPEDLAHIGGGRPQPPTPVLPRLCPPSLMLACCVSPCTSPSATVTTPGNPPQGENVPISVPSRWRTATCVAMPGPLPVTISGCRSPVVSPDATRTPVGWVGLWS